MRTPSFFIAILAIALSSNCLSQENISISDPIIQLKNNSIIVYYDIVNNASGDEFNVWMDVTDSIGNWIIPEALEGDIGENIEGGRRKKVVWNLTKDSIYMNTLIFVQVNAELVKKAEPELVYMQQPVTSNTNTSRERKKIGMTKGMLMLKSAVVPGWGLTQAKHKPHWIKGVVGYGLLATSLYYLDIQLRAHDDYYNAISVADRDFYYEKWQNTNKIYEGCLYGAIGVWSVDLLWTLIAKTKPENNKAVQNFSIQSTFEPVSNAPLLTLQYRF